MGVPKGLGLHRYRSHKTVSAAKIKAIRDHPAFPDQKLLDLDGGFSYAVDQAYMAKHQPAVGGYYVLYEDGYQSFSPAEPFEAGYTRI